MSDDTTGRTIPLDAPTRAFFQGVTDGTELANSDAGKDAATWAFFAGRAFALRCGQDQSSVEANAYVQGAMTRKPTDVVWDEKTTVADAAANLSVTLAQSGGVTDPEGIGSHMTGREAQAFAYLLRAVGLDDEADDLVVRQSTELDED